MMVAVGPGGCLCSVPGAFQMDSLGDMCKAGDSGGETEPLLSSPPFPMPCSPSYLITTFVAIA